MTAGRKKQSAARDARAGLSQRTEPQGRLDHIAVDRYPLRLGVGGYRLVRDAGSEFDAEGGSFFAQFEVRIKWRAEVFGVEDALGARAARRVGPQRVNSGRKVVGQCIAVCDGDIWKGPQIYRGNRGGGFVLIEGEDVNVQGAEGHGIGANPAREVGNVLRIDGAEALGMAGSNG